MLAATVRAVVRVEGLRERVGNMVLNCTGGAPGAKLRGELTLISFDGPVTNRALADGARHITVSANKGLGGDDCEHDGAGGGGQLGDRDGGAADYERADSAAECNRGPVRVALAAGPIRKDAAPFTVGITQREPLAPYATMHL
jgi:hypothetical protein